MDASPFYSAFLPFARMAKTSSKGAIGNALYFKEIEGDLGLRNAVNFFWNAKGITWKLDATVDLEKTENIVVGFTGAPTYNPIYEDRTISETKSVTISGHRDIAEKLYGSTHTAAFQPSQRAVDMAIFSSNPNYLDYGHLIQMPTTPWRGQDDFIEHHTESERLNFYDIDNLSLSVLSKHVFFDPDKDRYGIAISINGSAGFHISVKFPYSGPDSPAWISAEARSYFYIDAHSVPNSKFQTSLVLPNYFEPAYVNPEIYDYFGNYCIGGAFRLELGINNWTYAT